MTSSSFDDVIHISVPDVWHVHLSTFIESIYLGSVPTDDDLFEGWKYMVKYIKPAVFDIKSGQKLKARI
jgi:hypothetical protein